MYSNKEVSYPSVLVAAALVCCAPITKSQTDNEAMRIVTLGAMPAELVIQLGEASRLVGMDLSAAVFEEHAPQAKVLNYHRQTSSEGVLSTAPTHVILTDSAGPQAALSQIQAAGIQMVTLEQPESWSDVIQNVSVVAKLLAKPERGSELISQMNADKKLSEQRLEQRQSNTTQPRVLFVLSGASGGTLLCAGEGSGAETVIAMAGGQNAAKGFQGFKAIGTESLVQLDPDLILYPSGGAGPHGGNDMAAMLLSHPGLRAGQAVQGERVYGVDMVKMLGFGPSLGSVLVNLVELFYPEPNGQQVQASAR